MVVLLDSIEIGDLEKAVKEHGAGSVYWFADGTRRREGEALGLSHSQVLPIQQFLTVEAALDALGEGAEMCDCHTKATSKPKVKPKAKKAPKSE